MISKNKVKRDMEEDNFTLELIPEERFVDRLKNLHKSEVVCSTCSKIVTTIFYPYGYDAKENDVWYIGLCPNCGEVMYVKD